MGSSLVVYSPGPSKGSQVRLQLASGATVHDALRASGLLDQFPEIDLCRQPVGVWGRKVSPAVKLQDNDRIEIYRPLPVEPKVARRERFTRQGTRGAGLFASRRQGAKAGY